MLSLLSRAALAWAFAAGPAVGVATPSGPAVSRVAGRVVRPGAHALVPVPGQWVTLHRVGPDTAHPLDSMRIGPAGRYSFTYRRTGSDEAVYFVSTVYDGIAYFSSPLHGTFDSGATAEITVFDTTSAAIPLHVRGRHLIVSAASPTETRSVVEVFELSNDTSVTAVSPGERGDRPTWTSPIPSAALAFHGMDQGDVPSDAMADESGRAEVFAPFAPGLKQVSFTYTLPVRAFPLELPLAGPTSVLEVLVEEVGARVEAPGLREVNPVSVSGHSFRRYLAENVPNNASVRVTFPGKASEGRATYFAILMAVCGVAMLVALAYALLRRS